MGKFQMRKEMMETYGFWSCSGLTDADVRWWYTMSDVPVDVIYLVTYIMSRWDVPSPSASFSIIAGDKGGIAFSVFENVFSRRFEERGSEQKRLHDIFRYFDDSGDGKVSAKEWFVLDEIWSEIRLSVQEFAQFLQRTFQAEVEATWEFFDKDKSGDVTEAEWSEAVTNLGYFGPVKTIYAFLDPLGRGFLRKEAFNHLHHFQQSILGVSTHA